MPRMYAVEDSTFPGTSFPIGLGIVRELKVHEADHHIQRKLPQYDVY